MTLITEGPGTNETCVCGERFYLYASLDGEKVFRQTEYTDWREAHRRCFQERGIEVTVAMTRKVAKLQGVEKAI